PEFRTDIEYIRNLPVLLPSGKQVPLSELADIDYATGPAKISRDNTRRRVVVSVNVRNRDLESVVKDIELILDQKLLLPSGYSLDYGGQFENLRNATKRLKLAVPIALLLIFIFLHFAFKSFKEAALIFTAVPLSIVGGVFLLWIRGMPFSISAGIGFIALFGVAVLNGIVLIEHLKDLKKQGIIDMRERVLKGTRERLRPVLLTASAAALGFLPMAISTSAGAEVQRPLATVVIGGLVTSTLLTMLALPLLYAVVDDITGIQLWPLRFKRGKAVKILLLLLIPSLAVSQSTVLPGDEAKVLSLNGVLELAFENNSELKAYSLMAEESNALIRTAFSIDKTSLYYSYDENNIAANDYPIGVLGGEQRFDFPTVYFAQKKANTLAYNMAVNRLDVKKREITREVSKAYYNLLFLKNMQTLYEKVDSIYTRFSLASETSYNQGAITYLELLNAQSKHQEVFLIQSQVQHDIDIAYEHLSTLIQFDSVYTISNEGLQILLVKADSVGADPGLHYLQNAGLKQNAELKVEKNLLLPELTLGYFNGANRYEGAENYQGFEVGVGVPLFFGEQRARVKAKQFAMEATANLQTHYIRSYENRISALKNGLTKYQEAINYYERTGKHLAKELVRSSQKSYSAGEIDFFRLAQSLDQAIAIELAYLDNLNSYNQIVLDINYMTLEN
ncbi:MAG: CusA/CzcA family heavy metal efflux RND transporter, partial [Bacteroidetes bacterium]|nr:CusA/CzcA family heavy metal efflux RND transporter [Bacteroidota bacterium]